MEDKAVGRVTEVAGSLTDDETLEAEGRALGGAGQRSTYRVLAQPEGGWIVECLSDEGPSREKSQGVGEGARA